ncbi:MAG: hypothetical protein Q9208_007620 [Pyrenodesmia sp. 3 TL-2023]
MTNDIAIKPSLLSLPSPEPSSFQPPSAEELLGEWFIVQTSLPYFRDKRNVKITYTPSASGNTSTQRVHDELTYQTLSSDQKKTIRGVNNVSPRGQPGAWDWRGSGWVKVVSNHLEIIGHGLGDRSGMEWIMIHTERSFFAPAAIHVYSRVKAALPESVKARFMDTLVESPHIKALLGDMYEVQQA